MLHQSTAVVGAKGTQRVSDFDADMTLFQPTKHSATILAAMTRTAASVKVLSHSSMELSQRAKSPNRAFDGSGTKKSSTLPNVFSVVFQK
jgi:hypothetical protein